MPSKAEILYEKLCESRNGWKRSELEDLYLGFGFEISPGGKHDKVRNSKYPQLITTLGRHRKLASGYARTAQRLVSQFLELEQQAKQKEEEKNDTESKGTGNKTG